MWYGSASGHMLPPMVMYKSKHVYENCVYKLWIVQLCEVPNVEGMEGPVVLLGNNLGLHFSSDVICMAKEKNIYFAMLPPNAMHLLHPLDFAEWGPMKPSWRAILKEYRVQSLRRYDIQKVVFPRLLKLLWKHMWKAFSNNLEPGLSPLNQLEVLKMLQGYSFNFPHNKSFELHIDKIVEG